jgi:hypothetical protein
MAAGARADAEELDSGPARHWEIAYQGFGDCWYRLGVSEGRTPGSALRAWVAAGRTVRAGTHGVRLPTEVEWRPFRVSASGNVSPIDRGGEDDVGAAGASMSRSFGNP